MAGQKYFDKFLHNIEPKDSTVADISRIQINLRDYLANHEEYKNVLISSFLSGSYAKHTCIRPTLYDNKRDVDIVVETVYGTDNDSQEVISELCDVLLEAEKYSTAYTQHHSVRIEMSGLDIDVVPITTADEDGEQFIGSSAEDLWELTDPKGHISWSSDVNKESGGKYKPLVKAMKWWRKTHCPDDEKWPKGITLEKIIADNLPDNELCFEDYIIQAIQNVVAVYKDDVEAEQLPAIDDPSIPDNDLLAGYEIEEFCAWYNKLKEHQALIENSGTTNEIWREVFGNEFPKEDQTSTTAGLVQYVSCQQALAVAHRQRPLWPMQCQGANVMISLCAVFPDGTERSIGSDEGVLPRDCTLYYRALHSVQQPYVAKWQVVNTGQEAENIGELRGGFYSSSANQASLREESTRYMGKHFVQCFILKGNVCVARSEPFFINIGT